MSRTGVLVLALCAGWVAQIFAGDLEAERFYRRWREDGFQVVAATQERRFSGGPAVMLLDDRVIELRADGSRSTYVHQLVRVLSKEGLQKYGEVSLPAGARVLELRTVRADATIAEPELLHYKDSISMPGAAPGDVIEQEYVVDSRSGDAPAQFYFGSFAMPVLRARLVVIAPADQEPAIYESGGVPAGRRERSGNLTLRIWEQKDIAQLVRETAMLPRGNLPFVEVGYPTTWDDVRARHRARSEELARAGKSIEDFSREIAAVPPEKAARKIFERIRLIREHDGAGAEETLATGEGSRLGALLALARAAEFETDLLLGRNLGSPPPHVPAEDAYSVALVRLRKAGAEFVLDPASDAFGQLAPVLAPEALVVPVFRSAHEGEPMFVSLALDRSAERSVAEGEVRFAPDGSLEAQMTIRMGAARGGELRGRLRAMAAVERRQFFSAMGQRIFSRATEVRGEAENLAEAGRPLELRLWVRASGAAPLTPAAEIEQLVPTLGLRKMYVGATERRFALLVESPLIETAVFRIHLPDGLRLAPREFTTKTEFGRYTFALRESDSGSYEVRREFDVPAQVIAPERYAEFRRFALEIDQAERRRLALEVAPATLRAD